MTNTEKQADICISGRGRTAKSSRLCEFACSYGFCLESLCECTAKGPPRPLRREKQVHRTHATVLAKDSANQDLNYLCQFSCKYGHCPDDVCTIEPYYPVDDEEQMRKQNARKCDLYKEPQYWGIQKKRCELVCKEEIEKARKAGRKISAICVGFWPLNKPVPWKKIARGLTAAPGTCHC
ncbi:hypothetical protein LX36DRAFT_608310, partial [Colletotrichum falcatum]